MEQKLRTECGMWENLRLHCEQIYHFQETIREKDTVKRTIIESGKDMMLSQKFRCSIMDKDLSVHPTSLRAVSCSQAKDNQLL
jgi:hypothetical protein